MYFPKVHISKAYFSRVYFSKYFSKVYFPDCIFSKCTFPSLIFHCPTQSRKALPHPSQPAHGIFSISNAMMNTIDKNRIADFCESESALVPCNVWLRVEVRGVLRVGNLTPHLLGLAGSLSTLGWLSTQLPHFQETSHVCCTRTFPQH